MRITTLFAALAIQQTADALECYNEHGSPVDTWSIFKLPHGTDYFYYDPTVGTLTESQYVLNDTYNGALTLTVQQLWQPAATYAIFNDELPTGGVYNFSVGHTKGVWMWDNSSALIITQSTPKYPSGPSSVAQYQGIPSNGWMYGQSATCVKVDLGDFAALTALWQTTVPQIYDFNCGEYECPWSSAAASVTATVYGENSCAVKQQGSFTWFFKTAVTAVDIWADCVGSYFQTELSVESWIHGDAEGPYCSPNYTFSTVDIQEIAFSAATAFSEYNDHSKWGIGQNSLVCMGDINRMVSQYSRGGAVACWWDEQLWNSLSAAVQETNSC